MGAAVTLSDRFAAISGLIGSVAERVSRRYFTLLPVARSLTLETEPRTALGANISGTA